MSETFGGDDEYSIECTGDAVVGDEVRFSRAKFTGSYRKPKFAGYEEVTGKIIKGSYGQDKQQHTFTLDTGGEKPIRIKGRNVYREGTYRKPWDDESERQAGVDEKHLRGDAARAERDRRISGDQF